MIDLQPAPVPELGEEWIASHGAALIDALGRPPRRPLRWMALAGGTGAAAAVSSLVLVGGSAQSAFAGWSSSPTPPATGQVTTAAADCQAQIAQLPPSNKSNGTDFASLAPELSDVRGPYTVTVFGDGSGPGLLCVSAPGATSLRFVPGSDEPVAPGLVSVEQVSLLAKDGQPYTLVLGRTGTGVTGVALTLGNGDEVTASSGDGVFVAWWPGSLRITSADVSTTSGATTEPLDLPGPPIPQTPKSSPDTSGAPTSSSDPSTVCHVRCP